MNRDFHPQPLQHTTPWHCGQMDFSHIVEIIDERVEIGGQCGENLISKNI